jgi:hypothetical protein
MDPMQQAGLTAQMDQAAASASAGAVAIAGVLGAYFKTLRAQGLTRAEALTLTLDYQSYLFTPTTQVTDGR